MPVKNLRHLVELLRDTKDKYTTISLRRPSSPRRSSSTTRRPSRPPTRSSPTTASASRPPTTCWRSGRRNGSSCAECPVEPIYFYRAVQGTTLIHKPADAFWFVGAGVAPGDQAPDPAPHRLEVAQAGPDRPLQVRQALEQPVVRRPPPQQLPEPLDHVQLRAVARQPLELQVRVVGQRLVDRLAPVPRGVVDDQHHPLVLARPGRAGRRAAGGRRTPPASAGSCSCRSSAWPWPGSPACCRAPPP